MRTTKELNKNNLGSCPVSAQSLKARQNKGITLIALVITIIVMLILVAVTISMAVNGGLFDYAGNAKGETQNAIDEEQQLASGKVEIDGVWYNSIDDYINNNSTKKETSEDFFIIDEETGEITIVEDTSENHDGIGWYYTGANETGDKMLSEEHVVIPATINGITVKSIMKGPGGGWSYHQGGFGRAKNLKSVVIPSTVTKIGDRAFSGCTNLETVVLHDGLMTIGAYAFQYCSSLREITIPYGVTSIDIWTFDECSSLEMVKIPNSVTFIHTEAFRGCTNLTTITLEKGSTLEIPTGKWGATNATIIQEQ